MSDPLAVPVEDVAARQDFYLDVAVRRPVGITRDGTMLVVMLLLKDDARLVRRDRQAIRTGDLEGETLDATSTPNRANAPRTPGGGWPIRQPGDVLFSA